MSIKRDIFRRTSVVSAWALRPMVPFAFYCEKPAFPDRKELPVVPPKGISFGDMAEMNGQFFLQSDECRQLCGDITGIIAQKDEMGIQPVKDSGITGGVFGIHLWDASEEGSKDAEEVSKQLIAALSPEQMTWKSCSVSLFKVETGGDNWWERVVLETIKEVRLHKPNR